MDDFGSILSGIFQVFARFMRAKHRFSRLVWGVKLSTPVEGKVSVDLKSCFCIIERLYLPCLYPVGLSLFF
jgi:hypothetical protein